MTPHEWDRHRMAYCWKCARSKGCLTYNAMTKNSNDPAGSVIKDGACANYKWKDK